MRHDFRYIKTAMIGGKRFEVVWRCPRRTKTTPKNIEYHGDIDHPQSLGKRLRIGQCLKEEALLEAVFHEVGHGRLPDIEEKAIEEITRDSMRLLRRMGLKVSFEPKKKVVQ